MQRLFFLLILFLRVSYLKILCTDIHPQTLKELADGVILFWKTKVDAAYCIKKIDHLQKVITKVISVTGKASGYYKSMV